MAKHTGDNVRKLANYPLVAVVWDDAFALSEQTTMEEIESSYHKAQRFTTFGLLLKESEAGITLAGEIESNGQFRHVSFIPRGMIVEMVLLGVPRRKVKRAKTTPTSRPDDGAH